MSSPIRRKIQLRQTTLQFSHRKSTRLRAVNVARAKSEAAAKAAKAATLLISRSSSTSAKRGRKRKAKDAVAVVQETEEQRERKRQLKALAEERQRERLEKAHARFEAQQARLTAIRAAFDLPALDHAIAHIAQPHECARCVPLANDAPPERREGDVTEEDRARLPPLLSLDLGEAVTESLMSPPPLASPSSPSSSSSRSSSPFAASTASSASADSLSSPAQPNADPVVDFDLESAWPFLTSHSLFYLLAYSPLPQSSLFHPPGLEAREESAPKFKAITKNQWRGKRATVRRARDDEDDEGDGRCGCRSKPKEELERERVEAQQRDARRAKGCPTEEDVAWEAEVAARRAAADSGYLQKAAAPASFNCGPGCLNALLLVECDDSNCSVGPELCGNRHFTRPEEALLEPFPTELKGWGLRAKVDLPADRFLIEYVGEVIDNAECRRRIEKEDARVQRELSKLRLQAEMGRAAPTRSDPVRGSLESNYYFMSVCDDVIIDAGMKGSAARFINHSCNANCIIAKWTVRGELRIAIFTQRPIKQGEELTIDYKYDRIGLEYQACYCGSDNCAGWIGAKKKLPDQPSSSHKPHKKKASTKYSKQVAFSKADDVCGVCGGPGEIIVCDGKITAECFCPRVFHLKCVELDSAPRSWICPWHFCDGREDGDGGEKGEHCGRKAEQFCVGCASSRCRRCRQKYGELGVRWRESGIYRRKVMDESTRDWLMEEGQPEDRWVVCPDCENQPLVMREQEELAWAAAKKAEQNGGAEQQMADTHVPGEELSADGVLSS